MLSINRNNQYWWRIALSKNRALMEEILQTLRHEVFQLMGSVNNDKPRQSQNAIAKGFTSFNSWWKESCMNGPIGKSWLTMSITTIYEYNSCCFLIGCKLQEGLPLAIKSTNKRGVGVMLRSLRHQQLQSWLVFWPVNTWLLPPAIEGSETFSYGILKRLNNFEFIDFFDFFWFFKKFDFLWFSLISF